MCRETLEHSALNGMSSSNPSTEGSVIWKRRQEAERLEEPEVVDDSEETMSSGHSRADLHMSSQRL